jgi:hypothetical protein
VSFSVLLFPRMRDTSVTRDRNRGLSCDVVSPREILGSLPAPTSPGAVEELRDRLVSGKA